MGASKKGKVNITKEEFACFLRKAADKLEGKDISDDCEISFEYENLEKVRFTIKRKEELWSLKTKINSASCKDDISSNNKDKYKALKKQMKSSFKMVIQDIEGGVVPTGDHISEFLSDSEKMIGFEGFGDEYFSKYKKAYESLKSSCKQNDLSQCRIACNEIKLIKTECHKKYK